MITLFLTIIAGILNAAMDSIAMKYNKSIFPKLFPTKDQFFNPLVSWKNKYKNGNPAQGPKFFGSTTFLAFTTDAWHLFKTSMLTLLFIGAVCYSPIIYPVLDVILFYIAFGTTFELFWSKIFVNG